MENEDFHYRSLSEHPLRGNEVVGTTIAAPRDLKSFHGWTNGAVVKSVAVRPERSS